MRGMRVNWAHAPMKMSHGLLKRMRKSSVDKVKSIVDASAVKADLAVNKAIDFVKEKANIVTAAPEEKKEDAEG